MHVSPPVRGTSRRHPGLANLRECPKNCRSPPARVLSHSRTGSFRRVSPGSGIVWLLCRTPLFLSPNPAIRGCSSHGDSQHHAVFPPPLPRRSTNMKIVHSALNLARKMLFSLAVTSTPDSISALPTTTEVVSFTEPMRVQRRISTRGLLPSRLTLPFVAGVVTTRSADR